MIKMINNLWGKFNMALKAFKRNFLLILVTTLFLALAGLYAYDFSYSQAAGFPFINSSVEQKLNNDITVVFKVTRNKHEFHYHYEVYNHSKHHYLLSVNEFNKMMGNNTLFANLDANGSFSLDFKCFVPPKSKTCDLELYKKIECEGKNTCWIKGDVKKSLLATPVSY